MKESLSARPVAVLTSCDHITEEVRRALLRCRPMCFAESEDVLHQSVARGVGLVVLHMNGRAEEGGMAGRLLRAVPQLAAPVLALSDIGTDGDDGAMPSTLLDDVLLVRAERWQSLLRAWAGQPERARQLVAELRLLHACAPSQLVPVLDPLMLAPELTLSVKRWSAECGVSRTQVYRDMTPLGMTPSSILDVVRAMHSLGPFLAGRPLARRGRKWHVVRTERRVLSRTLGITDAEISTAGEPGSAEVRTLIADRLRDYFECAPNRPGHALPAPVDCRT